VKPAHVVLLGLTGFAVYLIAKRTRAEKSTTSTSLTRRTRYGTGYDDASLPPELAALSEPLRTEAGNVFFGADPAKTMVVADKLRAAGHEQAAARLELRATLQQAAP
jgi:hypothetical protein